MEKTYTLDQFRTYLEHFDSAHEARYSLNNFEAISAQQPNPPQARDEAEDLLFKVPPPSNKVAWD